MFTSAIQTVRKSIFPIFYYSKKSLNVLGTGFFIDDKGHFMTAAHVIRAMPVDANLAYLGNIPHVKFTNKKPIPIQVIAVDDSKDLAIGKIDVDQLPPLKFALNLPEVGQSVSLCGYPMPMIKIKQNKTSEAAIQQRSFDVTTVRQYWQPSMLMDFLPPKILINKEFKSFLTQHAALPGMSGGPIFNLNGEVVGLTSSVWSRQIPLKKGKHPMIIENGVGVDLTEIHKFVSKVFQKVQA